MLQETRDAWKRFEEQLSKDLPEVIGHMGAPAEERQIREAEAIFGLKFPESIREFYLVHNGCPDAFGVSFSFSNTGYFIYSLDFYPLVSFPDGKQSQYVLPGVEKWRQHCESFPYLNSEYAPDWIGPVKRRGKDEGWNPKWIPIAGNDNESSWVCWDLDPAEGGCIGQVIYVDFSINRVSVIAPNAAAFLLLMTKDLQEGLTVISR